MDIRSLQLKNLGRFEDLKIKFAPTQDKSGKVTVLIGNNGAGKTSILKALATNLSWLVARIRSEKGNGAAYPEIVVSNNSTSALSSIDITDEDGNQYTWDLAKTIKGRKPCLQSNLADASRLANVYRSKLTNNSKTSLPLIAFYPVERVVLDVPLKIRNRHNFFQLDGYDKSLTQGVDFRRFFEWFREREDSENESSVPQSLIDQLQEKIGTESSLWEEFKKLNTSSQDRQLTAVRNAITSFIPEFSNLRVKRKPHLHMSVEKQGKALNVLQLSQGEKTLMALVGDVARRLAMMNPDLTNPLEGDGIILIDEVDLHLHPQWQRNIIQRLTTTFPNCQFVLTTHSPLVISDSKDLLVYSLDDSELTELPSQYGLDANTVLLSAMDTPTRNVEVEEKLNDLLDLIQDKELTKATHLLKELQQELNHNGATENIELLKASLLLRKQELRSEKNK